MLRTRLLRYGVLGLLICTSGCNFFRERLCCNRPGILTGRFGGTTGHPVELAHSDCATCQGTLTSGPVLGTPGVTVPGGSELILPTPNPASPAMPKINENSGPYEPGQTGRTRANANEAKTTK